MDPRNELKDVLEQNRAVRVVDDDIYSVLADSTLEHDYDRKARIYDFVLGLRLYHAVMWGCSRLEHISFARESISSGSNGRFLDAGCGSLMFTAESYLESNRPIVAFDESLAMLRLARQRLIRLAGSIPDRIMLLQGDLTDLPFRADSFQGVLCLNVVHHVADLAALIANLRRVMIAKAQLHLSALVYNRFIGDRYLNLLHASGVIEHPRRKAELRGILNHALGDNVVYRVKGNLAFASANLTRVETHG